MNIQFDDSELKRLRDYELLLLKWNKAINLVSDSNNFWNRHILDCAQLRNFVPHESEILDVGSGAGLPGIVLSILGYKVTMVESDIRKCQYLSECVRVLHLNANVLNERIEKVPHGNFQFITARAFSSVEKIISDTKNLRDEFTTYLLFKTEMANKELDNAKKNWLFHVEPLPSHTEKSHIIYKIYGVRHANPNTGP